MCGTFFFEEVALAEVPPLSITLHRVFWAVPTLLLIVLGKRDYHSQLPSNLGSVSGDGRVPAMESSIEYNCVGCEVEVSAKLGVIVP